MERLQFEDVARVQRKSLKFISTDVHNMAETLRKNKWEDSEDKFKADITQSAFFITAFKLAGKAFNAMADDGNEERPLRPQLDYFQEVVNKWIETNKELEKAHADANRDA